MRAGCRSILLTILLALVACTGGAGDRPALAAIDVVITPASLSMAVGAKASFAATVTGVADTSVTWSVAEGSTGGSIDASGVYVAPSTAGTYHVVTTSRADPSVSAVATVTVSVDASAAGVAVTIAPTAVLIAIGARQTFSCGITGVSDTSCILSVLEHSGGTVDGAGNYTAPQTTGTFHVMATSRANPSKSATATIVVADPSTFPVAVTPASVTMFACQSVNLSASLWGTTSQAVTWSVQEGGSGGTITTQGVYTAPSAAGTYHVIATSRADGTKTASAAIVVSEKVVSISVSPANVSLQTGQTVQFSATVTTTCGTFASTSLVTS